VTSEAYNIGSAVAALDKGIRAMEIELEGVGAGQATEEQKRRFAKLKSDLIEPQAKMSALISQGPALLAPINVLGPTRVQLLAEEVIAKSTGSSEEWKNAQKQMQTAMRRALRVR
jgi:hypothetical protein